MFTDIKKIDIQEIKLQYDKGVLKIPKKCKQEVEKISSPQNQEAQASVCNYFKKTLMFINWMSPKNTERREKDDTSLDMFCDIEFVVYGEELNVYFIKNLSEIDNISKYMFMKYSFKILSEFENDSVKRKMMENSLSKLTFFENFIRDTVRMFFAFEAFSMIQGDNLNPETISLDDGVLKMKLLETALYRMKAD